MIKDFIENYPDYQEIMTQMTEMENSAQIHKESLQLLGTLFALSKSEQTPEMIQEITMFETNLEKIRQVI